ncbi:ABC transporter ATP-binding protein [Pseudaestuariivita atlantica]|uniref:ABC transporter ATP-binding protein n=1 Tax=Pseudaestuariivita atlantica TaxID=1317121 RepID=A0A0L1JL71_9RHOB|nr:ABC transporter ATP-binding protein [Pseudaestuariivita atlantica]KNG92173.1 ABC transporter ATP-binding protein [Pseudaestuariivita atlantica]
MLDATDLTKSYPSASGPVPVLAGVSMRLSRGETVALTGESGSGKSTLLHLLAALDTPDSGSILLDGEEITGLGDRARARLRRDRFGIVFQALNLVPSLTVAQNIAFQSRLADRYEPDLCDTLTRRLGLSNLAHRLPEDLSGGQQQRVAIGRALAARPSVLFADEPTGNLDEDTADQVIDLMLDLAADTGTACLMVTHSPRLAARLGRQVHLSKGLLS